MGGHQRASGCLSLLLWHKTRGKKSDQLKPANLTCFFLIKTRISSNNPVIATFSIGVDALPQESENRIKKRVNGARIGLQIDHVPGILYLPVKCPDPGVFHDSRKPCLRCEYRNKGAYQQNINRNN
jgi:hypothetical protein